MFDIFEMSLDQRRVPTAWKESIIVPVAKGNPNTLNDFRPVAPTSLVMKSFERIVKRLLLFRVGAALDPGQFAYRASRGVEDAQITLLNLLYSHLQGPGQCLICKVGGPGTQRGCGSGGSLRG